MSGSVNKVILVGNLGRDPEVRTLNSGDKVANLSVATSERAGISSGPVTCIPCKGRLWAPRTTADLSCARAAPTVRRPIAPE